MLHLTLDKENKWTIKPEFVLDSDPHKEVALDDSLEETTDEYIVSSHYFCRIDNASAPE